MYPSTKTCMGWMDMHVVMDLGLRMDTRMNAGIELHTHAVMDMRRSNADMSAPTNHRYTQGHAQGCAHGHVHLVAQPGRRRSPRWPVTHDVGIVGCCQYQLAYERACML